MRVRGILCLALLMCLGLVPAALAAEETPERGVVTYTEVISPQYEDAHSFCEGLAAVKKDGKWGYIDTAGRVAIPFQYVQAYDFNEGLAIVTKVTASEEATDREWDVELEEFREVPTTRYTVELGFLDKMGNYKPFLSHGMNDDSNDFAPFQLELDSVSNLDFEGNDKVFRNGYVWLYMYEHDGFYLFNTAGNMIRDAEGRALSTLVDPVPVNEGLAVTGSFWDSSYQYVDVKTGKTVLDSQSILGAAADGTGCSLRIDPRPFNQGLAPVYVLSLDEETQEWGEARLGFIDRRGNWVIQPTLGNNYFFFMGEKDVWQVFGETGLGMVKGANGKYGAIDKQGNTVIPFQYDELWSDNEGRAEFRQNGKYGYLDAAGDHAVVIPAQFEKASGYHNGLAAVYDGTKAYLIDWDGNAVPGTEELDPDAYFREDKDGIRSAYVPDEYLTIRRDGKYGFGHIEYLPELPAKEELHDWAYEEVTAAIEADLVPTSMQNLYDNAITRGEFCTLAVQAIEAVTGKDIEGVVKEKTGKELSAFRREYPFPDANGSDVISCYALGILQGRGNGVADPYASITRQEAAAYLARTAKVMGMDVSTPDALPFSDADSVGRWFTQAVAFVCENGVMNGTGNNRFTPLGSYTREQSYATFYRLYNAVK